MPSMLLPSTQPTMGFGFGKKEALFWNRTGTTRAIGDLLLLDLDASATETTNYLPGDSGSAFANLVDAVAADCDNGTYVVMKTAAVNDTLTECVCWGLRVDVRVENNQAGNVPDGGELFAPFTAAFDHLHAEATIPDDSQRLGFYDEGQPVLATASSGLRRAGVFTGFGHFGVSEF